MESEFGFFWISLVNCGVDRPTVSRKKTNFSNFGLDGKGVERSRRERNTVNVKLLVTIQDIFIEARKFKIHFLHHYVAHTYVNL